MNTKLTLCLIASSLLLSSQVIANTETSMGEKSETSSMHSNGSATQNAHDAAITTGIKKLIGDSQTLSGQTIDVSTQHGVVHLTGMVDSDSQATSVVEIAQSIVGVKDVDASKLTVKDSQQPLTDSYITAKVKAILIREKLFGDKDIASMGVSVETKDGTVYLTGQIDNKQQIKNAIKVLEGVKGVKKVVFNVKKITPVS